MTDYQSANKRVVSQQVSTVVEYEIFDTIEDHEQYVELRDDLYRANENDIAILKINSPGGNVDVGLMIVKAIQESKANVIARVMFPSASMASLIALSCDFLVMDKYSELMFHSYAGGNYGRAHEILESTTSWHKHLTGIFDDILGKFLTKKEKTKMWEGAEIRICWNSPDLEERIRRHYKWTNA